MVVKLGMFCVLLCLTDIWAVKVQELACSAGQGMNETLFPNK